MSGLDNTSFTTRTALTTVDSLGLSDSVLICPFGGTTVVVPVANPGRTYTVVSVIPGGTGLISAANINGISGYTVNERVELVFDGTAWWTISAS